MNKFPNKYEKAKLIGARAMMIDAGSNIKLTNIELEQIKIDNKITELTSLIIAEKEYELNKIPFIIKQNYPNEHVEYLKFYKN